MVSDVVCDHYFDWLGNNSMIQLSIMYVHIRKVRKCSGIIKRIKKLKLPSNYHEINTLKSKCVEIFQRFTTFEMKCMNSYEIEMHSEAMKNYEQWYICDIKMNFLAQKENAQGSEIQLNRQIVTISKVINAWQYQFMKFGYANKNKTYANLER